MRRVLPHWANCVNHRRSLGGPSRLFAPSGKAIWSARQPRTKWAFRPLGPGSGVAGGRSLERLATCAVRCAACGARGSALVSNNALRPRRGLFPSRASRKAHGASRTWLPAGELDRVRLLKNTWHPVSLGVVWCGLGRICGLVRGDWSGKFGLWGKGPPWACSRFEQIAVSFSPPLDPTGPVPESLSSFDTAPVGARRTAARFRGRWHQKSVPPTGESSHHGSSSAS